MLARMRRPLALGVVLASAALWIGAFACGDFSAGPSGPADSGLDAPGDAPGDEPTGDATTPEGDYNDPTVAANWSTFNFSQKIGPTAFTGSIFDGAYLYFTSTGKV